MSTNHDLVPISSAVSLGEKIELSTQGLTVREELTREEFIDSYNTLERIDQANSWWKGDLALAHDPAYGELKQLAEENGWDYGAMRVYKSVAENFEVLTRVNNLSFKHHQIAAPEAGKEKDHQSWLQEAEEGEWTTRELAEAIRMSRIADSPPLPEGIFNVIYTDPPWSYDNTGFASSAVKQYPTLSVEAIANFADEEGKPVQDLFDKDSVLFLWATMPNLREALQVIETWGFEYKTGMVWTKGNVGMGFYFRVGHELLLFATKGQPGTPAQLYSSILEAPRTNHSKKPQEIYDTVEGMYPHGTYLELFARNARSNWTSWGNELTSE